ncbi:MAG: hypothetical protein HUJ76_03030, partial [Parasporobacterium sp.]|nr:hypothetical protein [Parasporobacterium sp.]
MKKNKTLVSSVAILAAASMMFSMSAMAAEPAAQSEGAAIVDVVYGAGYVATAATEDDTINSPSASSNIAAVILSDGTEIKAEGEGVLTLVIDGVQYDILDFLESGAALPANAEFATTAGKDQYSEPAKFMNMGGNTAEYTNRQALKVTADGIDDSETIPSLLNAEYDAAAIRNGSIISNGAFFNGIIVDSAPFAIEKMEIIGLGDGANDFRGAAAMVLSQGSADITIADSTIFTQGVIRTAAAVKDNGILRINNSVIYTEETADTQAEYDALVVPMMKRTPFALGLEGVVRATNVLGAGQGIYSDSLIVSSGWGVLSTDSGSGYNNVGTYALDVTNTVAGTGLVETAQEGKEYFATKEVNGVTYGYTAGGSGYVAYADSGVFDKFDNVKFYGGNEVQIMASSNSSAFYTNSELNSGHIGVMTQQNAGGTISIVDSVMNVAETGVQIKSGAANNGYTNVILDNTTVNFTADSKWGKTLVELVESDDAGNPGNTTFTIDDNGDLADAGTATAIVDDSNATLANGEYTGNIWNNIYNKYQVLNVTLDAATVNGTISSSYSYHLNDDGTRMENGTVLQADTTGNYLISGVNEYHKIGAQYNVANAQVNNPLNLTLTNNSTWNIVLADGTCGEAAAIYLNNVTIEEGSAIVSENPVELHLYGELVGEVGENITVIEEEAVVPAVAADEIYAYDMADPRHTATIIAVDEEGNKLTGAIKFDAYKAFSESYFTIGGNGYEVISLEVTDGDATLTAIAEGEEYFGEYEYKLAMNEDCTITVTVKKAESAGSDGGSGGGESAGEPSEGGEGGESADASAEGGDAPAPGAGEEPPMGPNGVPLKPGEDPNAPADAPQDAAPADAESEGG